MFASFGITHHRNNFVHGSSKKIDEKENRKIDEIMDTTLSISTSEWRDADNRSSTLNVLQKKKEMKIYRRRTSCEDLSSTNIKVVQAYQNRSELENSEPEL